MATAHQGRTVVREKARALIKQSWQSQANLSFFLALLVTAGFILPSLGFGKSDELLYADWVYSLMLVSGVAIAWGRRWLFLLSVQCCQRNPCSPLDGILYPDPYVASMGRRLVSDGDHGDCPGAVSAGFSRRAG